MNTPGSISPAIGNFAQPVMPIADPSSFHAVRSAIETAFSPAKAGEFLKSVARQDTRIREFERVLAKGLLGEKTKAEYGKLGNGDQGQIREFYLASLEQVSPELREKFFKLYAYY